MKKMQLHVVLRRRYRVTTQSSPDHTVVNNVLDRQFNPTGVNEVWACDITYLKTGEGWLYLAIIMDLYARRVVGWSVSPRINQALTKTVLNQAIVLRRPPRGLLHHSDRGGQYTCKGYQKLLKQHDFISSMSRKGNCWE